MNAEKRRSTSFQRLITILIAALTLQGTHMGYAFAQALPFEEFGRNWGLNNIGVLWPWGAGATGNGSIVALVDSGVDASHSDLAGQILPGIDFVDGDNSANDLSATSHGTFVAGIIAGRRNGGGIVGVAHDAKLLPIRVTDQNQEFTEQNLAAGINFAANSGARIINIAIASGAPRTPEVLAALQNAANANKLIVMPAGNTGSGSVLFPAFFANSLGGTGLVVGAVGPDGQIASFSNRAGSNFQNFVLAPGVDVQSSTRGGGFDVSSGTSWATGFVSGAAALLLGAFPQLSAATAAQILKETATDLGPAGPDSTFGWGVINLRNAMAPQGELQLPGGGDGGDGGGGGGGAAIAVAAVAIGGAIAWSKARKNKDLKTAVILDQYGRGYQADISGIVQPGSDQHSLTAVMSSLSQSAHRVGLRQEDIAAVVLDFNRDRRPPTINEIVFDPEVLTQQHWRAAFDQTLGGGVNFAYRRNASLGMPGDDANDLSLGGSVFGTAVAASPHYLDPQGDNQALALNWRTTAGFAMGVGVSQSRDDERFANQSNTRALDLSYPATNRLSFGLRLSETREHGGLLGGPSNGPFSVDQATTSSIRVSARYRFNDKFSVLGAWQIGRTKVIDSDAAIVNNFSTIRSRAWGIGVMTHSLLSEGDSLGISVSRPLKVTSGSAFLSVPTGFDRRADIVRRNSRWDLSPDANETDIELFYLRQISAASNLGAYLLFRDNAFNSREYGNDLAVLATYRLRF